MDYCHHQPDVLHCLNINYRFHQPGALRCICLNLRLAASKSYDHILEQQPVFCSSICAEIHDRTELSYYP